MLAYLAQFDGGTFTTKELTSKSTDTASGKLSLENALEFGEESQQEASVSRQITATAAGNYIELLSKLEGLKDGLMTVGLGHFESDIAPLTEGQFVTFRTHGLRPPIYLNPYLAVRQRQTLATVFPLAGTDGEERERVELQRSHSRLFRQSVGKDPRVVFAVRPLEEPHVQYLMPLDAQLLTHERSLIKFGGGEFTVVGKVVRIFPERGDYHLPAYVDSPTLETWEQPLAFAPLALLCRTDPECTTKLRSGRLEPAQRRRLVAQARTRALEALEEQTEIRKRGAVILPVAIYK